MGYFAETTTKRVVFKTNKKYWADIRDKQRWGQTKKFIKVDTESEGGDIDVDLSEFLAATIVAWNLDDETGNVVPIDAEHVDMLEQEDALHIFNKANADAELNEDPKEAKKN